MTAIHPYLDWPGPIAFAHRGGARGPHPENTIAAFRHAVDLGYTYLETDVHSTRDGVLVAFHDNDLTRTCGVPGRIDELTWDQVAAARVGGTEPIPRFDELVEEFPEARFNIDCKADSGVAGLTRAIRRHGLFDRVMVGSFSDRRLRRIRAELGPRVATSFGPVQIASLKSARRVPWGGQAAQVPIARGRLEVITERFVRRAHAVGIHVHVWTVDDPTEIDRLLDLGVDGIMTDDVEVLRSVLTERGQWV